MASANMFLVGILVGTSLTHLEIYSYYNLSFPLQRKELFFIKMRLKYDTVHLSQFMNRSTVKRESIRVSWMKLHFLAYFWYKLCCVLHWIFAVFSCILHINFFYTSMLDKQLMLWMPDSIVIILYCGVFNNLYQFK